MNKGDFTIDYIQSLLTLSAGVLVFCTQNAVRLITSYVINDPNEKQLLPLFKQSGLSVKIMITYKLIIHFIINGLLFPLISLVLKFLIMKNVSFGVIFFLLLKF